MIAQEKLLYTIPYREFELWDVKRYNRLKFTSHYPIHKLGKHINSETNRIKLFEFPDKDFEILGISNEIGMHDAYTAKGNTFNQAYKTVQNNFIAYNPYRINVGSIGIKMPYLKGSLISPAYVVFSCKETLLPDYLFLLMKTNKFNEIIRDNTSGSVRQNLTFDALSEIMIPVPSITEQERLINNYNSLISHKEKNIDKSSILSVGMKQELLKSLGIRNKNFVKENEAIGFIRFLDLKEWGIDKNINNINRFFVFPKAFSFGQKSELLIKAFRGKSPKYKEGTGAYILNQKCNRWDNIETQFAKTVDEKWLSSIDKDILLKEGDIIVNSTGEGTLGRASLVKKELEGWLVDSHMLVLRVNKQYVQPSFIVKQLNSEFGQKQVELLKGAQATKQTELGVDNLLKMKFVFPLNQENMPDIEKQIAFVDKYNNVSLEIDDLLQKSTEYEAKAKLDFENAVFMN